MRARARDEHVALDREERLAGPRGDGPVADERVAVVRAERQQLVHVEPGRVDERAVDRADRDDARAGVRAGTSGAGARLAEALDRDARALEGPPEPLEGDRGRAPDPVADREVVHPQPVVLARPDGRRAALGLEREEVVRMRPHVGPREEEVLPVADAVDEGPEHGRAVAAVEADPGLRAGVGDAADRELPGHRAREAGHFVGGHVRHHPRPAHRGREELVVDDDDGVEPDGRLDHLDHACRRRVVALEYGHGSGRYPTARALTGAVRG